MEIVSRSGLNGVFCPDRDHRRDGRRAAAGRSTAREDEVVVWWSPKTPDAIVAVPHANEVDIPSLTERPKSNPAWQSASTVQNDRLYISIDSSLLRAGTDVARTIRKVRMRYLENWPGQ